MKINTTQLQSMMTKAIKGVGNNQLNPITCMIALDVKDNVFTITSTDGDNYLYVKEPLKESTEDFYVCILADKFSKLVSKLTSDDVELTINDSGLIVSGNGTYTIEIPLDENSNIVQYPSPMNDLADGDIIESTNVDLATIKTILSTIKSGLADSVDLVDYTNYYVGNLILATDTVTISALSKSLLSNPILISANMMSLLNIVTDDTVKFTVYKNNKMIAMTDTVSIYGELPSGIESFPMDKLSNYITGDLGSNKCQVKKSELAQVLDRIALFVGDYDDNVIKLSFSKDKLEIMSKASTGIESVAVVSESDSTFDCMIDITKLQSVVKSQVSDVFTICYGDTNAIKIADGDITSVIALVI